MNLVGRADPRGGDEYNLVLGGSRGDNVKSHLVDQGMDPDHISSASRGEMDATGTNEAGWVQDRRVDVKLASER
jgi:peptidoglycan-associated lipoprotein